MTRPTGRFPSLPLATALRETFREGYGKKQLLADLLAGVVVGIVALPLAMALAIGAGVSPQYGLYTAMIAGVLIALFGGSRGSVSGPTAAFIVILHPIVSQHGMAGLLLATVMAGFMLVLLGAAGLGKLIEFIPYPVTTGFTSGIAVVIALLQVKYFFGLELADGAEGFVGRVAELARALPATHWPDLTIGMACLTIMALWPRLGTRVPAHLIAVVAGSLLALIGSRWVEGFSVATIGSEFSYMQDGVSRPGIPSSLPALQWPWHWPAADGAAFTLSMATLQSLIGPAFAIAMLGAIESLLCAVVVDSSLRTKHNPNAELIGQGIGNIVAPFFGGITATAAIARSATSVRAGARTPIAAITHGLVILLAIVSLSGLMAYVPMSALAALLLMTAWHMSEAKHFAHVLKIGPRSDKAVLLTCFGLTVAFDMVIAVGVGMVLAAMLFMHRVAALTDGRWLAGSAGSGVTEHMPKDTRFFEIDGPMFFGAAEKTIATLKRAEPDVHTVILWLGAVPMMDVTGLIALQSVLGQLRERRIFVILAGARPKVRALMESDGIGTESDAQRFVKSADEALILAQERYAARTGTEMPALAPQPVP